jgi:hypothetical protein
MRTTSSTGFAGRKRGVVKHDPVVRALTRLEVVYGSKPTVNCAGRPTKLPLATKAHHARRVDG